MRIVYYIFFILSIVLLMKNIWDYYKNRQYSNFDNMGAMINWHQGFFVSWILLCIGVGFYPIFEWYYGVMVLPLYFIVTYLVWFIVDIITKNLTKE